MAKYSAQFPFFYLHWLINRQECRLDDLTKHFQVRRETISRWNTKLKEEYKIEVKRLKNGRYCLTEESIDQIEKNSLIKWKLNTISLMDTLNSKEKLNDRIALEEVPSSNNLGKILKAMEQNQWISFNYIKYYDNPELEPHSYEHIEPYCVKLFERRWYVVCQTDEKKSVNDNGMRTFSLDQISDLQVSETTFKLPKNFSAEAYFKDVYGIITGMNDEYQTIEIRVDAKTRANYFRALPLHHSQEELLEKSNKDFVYFTYKLRPSEDFYQALLHHGEHVEVLSPDSVRKKMAAKVKAMAAKY